MPPGSDTPSPAGQDEPTPADVLRWCAAAGPELWFPSSYAAATGTSRDSLDQPLWVLRQTGLIQVGDWVRGQGQGFRLTPAGEQALADPTRIATEPPPVLAVAAEVPPAVPPTLTAPNRKVSLTTYERGEMAREALLSPPRAAIVAPALLMANIAWFLVGLVVAWRAGVSIGQYLKDGDTLVLLKLGAVSGPTLLAGDWWRLLLCGFVHIGGIHLFVNMLNLALSGPLVEHLWGRWRFAVIYVVSGLAGSAVAMAIRPDAILAGASGSVLGILMACLAWVYRYRRHLPPPLMAAWSRQLLIVMLLNAGASTLPGVSWEAHLGGGLAGFASAVLLDLIRPGNGVKRWIGIAGMAALLALGPAVLAIAMERNPKWAAVRQRERAVQRMAEVRQLQQAVADASFDRVMAAYVSATAALIAPSPESRQNAREAVDTFRQAAAAAREKVPSLETAARTYLDETVGLGDELAATLDANRPPSPEECERLGARWKAVKVANWGEDPGSIIGLASIPRSGR